MSFGEILVRKRKRRGLTQEELASRVQVSRQAVSKWETGEAAPDLTRLLALADALDVSLDELCGREAAEPTAEAAPAAPDTTHGRRWFWPVVCGALTVCLVVVLGLWAWNSRNVVPAETAAAGPVIPDAFTVSGLEFYGVSNYRVRYQFVPSICEEGYVYQISFTDFEGRTSTFDAPCQNGICSGAAEVNGFSGCSVTVSVLSGSSSRHLAVAGNLNFSEGSASWTVLEE